MAEYYIEIPSSPSVDRFGGRCGTFDKRFADADDFPQPAGGARPVLGISSGASLGVAFVVLLSGQLGGVALSRLGFIGEVALSIAAIVGSIVGDGADRAGIPESGGERDVVDYRGYDSGISLMR